MRGFLCSEQCRPKKVWNCFEEKYISHANQHS
jgi:hypothetical protein